MRSFIHTGLSCKKHLYFLRNTEYRQNTFGIIHVISFINKKLLELFCAAEVITFSSTIRDVRTSLDNCTKCLFSLGIRSYLFTSIFN